MTTTSTPAASAAKTPVAVKPAKYPESATIVLTDKGAAGNPKRAASAKRYQVYITYRAAKKTLTVKDYLDECLKLQPDEPRGRWRADLSWDLARGWIEVK